MVSLLLGSLLALACPVAFGVRSSKQQSGVKFVAGVPILNYHLAAHEVAFQSGEHAAEHWVVVAKDKVSSKKIHKMCSRAGLKGVECVSEGNPSTGGVPFFVVGASTEKLKALAKKYRNLIEFVERDTMRSLDPGEDHNGKSATIEHGLWGLKRVGVATRISTGKGVHVYVFDTGIRTSHVDFGGRASGAVDMTSGQLVECNDTDKDCANDVRGHGTHCAATSTGTTYGVASGAEVHSIKVLKDAGGGPWSWDYQSLDWVSTTAKRPAVVSASLGGRGVLKAYEVAVNKAVASGVVVVVAGGNSNDDACRHTPAFIPAAITVGSIDSMDRRSSFSNYGNCTQIWAPGSRIKSADVGSDTGSSMKSGTSMACPHVSGAAALLLEQGITHDKILETLVSRSEKDAITGFYEGAGDVNYLLWVGSK